LNEKYQNNGLFKVLYGKLNSLNKMPEPEQKTFQKRQVAYKVKISSIINSGFFKDDLSAGYIKINDMRVSRVNIIATLINKPELPASNFTAIIDDGTGRISLRSFEGGNIFSKAEIGDIVLVVGRVREFNKEKYIIPEILKKINDFRWMNLRKKELADIEEMTIDAESINMELEQHNGTPNVNAEICSIIKRLDSGEGVSIDDVIKTSGIDSAEGIIKNLLESGDIFEIRHGKLKVLE